VIEENKNETFPQSFHQQTIQKTIQSTTPTPSIYPSKRDRDRSSQSLSIYNSIKKSYISCTVPSAIISWYLTVL
jgi:hypothetical protein